VDLLIYKPKNGKAPKLSLFTVPVSAGFPSPAEEYVEQLLSLDEHLVKHQQATYLAKVKGDSMKEAGINTGDVLIIDKSLTPQNNKIVIAIIDGEFTVKRYLKEKGEISLVPANSAYKPIKVNGDRDIKIWGVVTYIIHKA
jgi:DNA polymerase V